LVAADAFDSTKIGMLDSSKSVNRERILWLVDM
jgi:hypothetical protein